MQETTPEELHPPQDSAVHNSLEGTEASTIHKLIPDEATIETSTEISSDKTKKSPPDLHKVPNRSSLPQKGLSAVFIAGTIAGLSYTLLCIVIIFITAGVFHDARLQIAADKLTVKTALALAGLELLMFLIGILICLLCGFIVGKIAARRRSGFLAGALAGALFSLITFFIGLIPGYPGTLVALHAAPANLLLSLLQLGLWSIGAGLVSLLGTWVATLQISSYKNRVEKIL